MSSSSNRTNSSRNIETTEDLLIWKLNRANTEISKEVTQYENWIKINLEEHKRLIKEASELDQIIRAQKKFVEYKEKQIVENTRRIQQHKSK
jgi:hypothetical protein